MRSQAIIESPALFSSEFPLHVLLYGLPQNLELELITAELPELVVHEARLEVGSPVGLDILGVLLGVLMTWLC